jgi:hypothetical protein
MRRFRLGHLLVSAAAIAFDGPPTNANGPAPARPSQVLLITVDQLRPDYLERFAGQLSTDLARPCRSSAVFTNAHQDHANPGTAPDLVADLRRNDSTDVTSIRRWLHAIPADVPAGVVVTLKHYSVWAGVVAQHGSGNDLDAYVPLILCGGPVSHRPAFRVHPNGGHRPNPRQNPGRSSGQRLAGLVLEPALFDR